MKEAKLKFKPGNFEIINSGDYVLCKVSGKKINLSENMANFSDVFLYLPDEEFLTFINQDPNFESKVVVSSKDGKNKWLYKIVKK